jgi:hypothetical protein
MSSTLTFNSDKSIRIIFPMAHTSVKLSSVEKLLDHPLDPLHTHPETEGATELAPAL